MESLLLQLLMELYMLALNCGRLSMGSSLGYEFRLRAAVHTMARASSQLQQP